MVAEQRVESNEVPSKIPRKSRGVDSVKTSRKATSVARSQNAENVAEADEISSKSVDWKL